MSCQLRELVSQGRPLSSIIRSNDEANAISSHIKKSGVIKCSSLERTMGLACIALVLRNAVLRMSGYQENCRSKMAWEHRTL